MTLFDNQAQKLQNALGGLFTQVVLNNVSDLSSLRRSECVPPIICS